MMNQKKLFAFGAISVSLFASLNVFVGVIVLGTIETGDPKWIRGSKLVEWQANIINDKVQANTAARVETNTSDNSNPLTVEDRRFPIFGTESFATQCQWTRPNTDKNLNCTFLARPPPNGGEGISNWVSQIVVGHLLAQQTGCNLIFDYGPNISIHDVLTPNTDFDHVNWRVPSGFDCDRERCFVAEPSCNKECLRRIESALGVENLQPVPFYRFAYKIDKTYFSTMGGYRDLVRALKGYTVETGMACSLGSLFQLSPSASQFEPDLFSRILPTLHDRKALVIAVYIRTGQTEGTNGKWESAIQYGKRAAPILDCALHLEKEFLSQGSYSRVVWMVVTDSQYLKKFITDSYDSRSYTNDTRMDAISREIVTTHSRGAHSKLNRSPSTADVAEALIDWYLIGESDLVVTDDFAPSFGDTAATRTVRPYYKVQGSEKKCAKVVPILK